MRAIAKTVFFVYYVVYTTRCNTKWDGNQFSDARQPSVEFIRIMININNLKISGKGLRARVMCEKLKQTQDFSGRAQRKCKEIHRIHRIHRT